jgi:mannose-6-phosphate isomerase-like protein (cupin superfamily)
MPFVAVEDVAVFSADKLSKNNFFDCPQMVADFYCLEPGQRQKIHHHEGEAKIYLVLSGRGEFTIGDERRELGPGGAACSPPGVMHGVNNTSDERLTALVVMAPNPNLRK